MPRRRPQALRDGDDRDLRQYLIATAARLIGERGAARLTVRDITREGRVAAGVLYNYFEDREDLVAHALLAHVRRVMSGFPGIPPAGTGTVAGNLEAFIEAGFSTLAQITPAFAGLLSQPEVLNRFYTMAGADGTSGSGSLSQLLVPYLRDEQRLGRVRVSADIDAAAELVIAAIHGQVLPCLLFGPPGAAITAPPGVAGRFARTVVSGIAPERGLSMPDGNGDRRQQPVR